MKKNKAFLVNFISYSCKGLTNFFVALPVLFIVLPAFLFSQTTIDDFKTASGYSKGVELIPFKDIRVDATSIAADVSTRKTETQSMGSGNFENQKKNMYEDIKKEKKVIEDLKKDIEDYKKKYTEVSTKCFEEEIAKYELKISKHNERIAELNSKIKVAIDAFERLYNARAGLREYFDKALTKLAQAKSNPATYLGESPVIGDNPTDEDKKKLEKYTEDKKKLLEYIALIETAITNQAITHKDEEDGAKTAKQKLEALLSKADF